MAKRKAPELTFQQHIAHLLVREHGHGVLELADITDTSPAPHRCRCCARPGHFEMPKQELMPGVTIAMVRDPDGNVVEFVQRA